MMIFHVQACGLDWANAYEVCCRGKRNALAVYREYQKMPGMHYVSLAKAEFRQQLPERQQVRPRQHVYDERGCIALWQQIMHDASQEFAKKYPFLYLRDIKAVL